MGGYVQPYWTPFRVGDYSAGDLGGVDATRSILAGPGLTGGGPLAADVTLTIGAGTGIVVNADDVAIDTAAEAERIRDVIGAALVAGTNITITVNDPGDTITIAATGGGSTYTDEQAQDAVAAMIAAGTNTGLTITYNDAGNSESLAIDTTAEAERIRDVIGACLVAGSNVTITVNDPGDTITIAAALAAGSVSIVQSKSFIGDNPTLTLDAVPTPGNILVAVAGVWNGVSSSNSPWVQVINTAGTANDGVYAAYRFVTANDTSATIAKPAIQGTSQGWSITIYEIAGAAYVPPVFDWFKEVSATSKTLNAASMKAGSLLIGCFNTNSGNPTPSSITGATAGTSVAGTSTGGSPRRANPFSKTNVAAGGASVTVNYSSAPTAITGIALVFQPA